MLIPVKRKPIVCGAPPSVVNSKSLLFRYILPLLRSSASSLPLVILISNICCFPKIVVFDGDSDSDDSSLSLQADRTETKKSSPNKPRIGFKTYVHIT